jgi:predicted DNA-binding transcriptional regulator AlpA
LEDIPGWLLGDDAAKALAEFLGPALKQAKAIPPNELDEGKDARLRASQNAIFAGQKPPDDQGLLIDSKQAAKLLKVSERTLWSMHHTGAMPPPIRIGRAVRWGLETLKKWVEEGCPVSRR